MNRFIPAHFVSAKCLFRPQVLDSLYHFVFECPIKLAVWEHVWSAYFIPPLSFSNVSRALFQLQHPQCQPWVSISASTVIGHTLYSIWRSRWAFVFDGVPFTTAATISSTTRMLLTASQELLSKQGTSPVLLPHIQV